MTVCDDEFMCVCVCVCRSVECGFVFFAAQRNTVKARNVPDNGGRRRTSASLR